MKMVARIGAMAILAGTVAACGGGDGAVGAGPQTSAPPAGVVITSETYQTPAPQRTAQTVAAEATRPPPVQQRPAAVVVTSETYQAPVPQPQVPQRQIPQPLAPQRRPTPQPLAPVAAPAETRRAPSVQQGPTAVVVTSETYQAPAPQPTPRPTPPTLASGQTRPPASGQRPTGVVVTSETYQPPAPRRPAPAVIPAEAREPVAPLGPTPAPFVLLDPQDPRLRTDDVIIAFIKKEEGFRADAYRGPSGKLLIGYGHGRTARPGMKITEAQAERLLREDLAIVEGELKSLITQPVSVNEFSAMVDLAYNVGTGNFRQSTVLRAFNAGDRASAADAFLLWNKMRVNGELVVSPVLAERREFERRHFLGG